MRASRRNAEDLIRSTGERVTAARAEILALLLAAPRALTRREIEEGLDASLAIDRVTVYRVLEWLTEQHLAHKISADDRVWRFNAVPAADDRQHAHFHCTSCGEVLCLEDLWADIRPRLPAGYAPQSLEVTVKGLCSGCGTARRRARRRTP